MTTPADLTMGGASPRPRPPEAAHAPFLLTALAFGLLGGFTLAVSLPLEALLGGIDQGWVAHAQVHGHLQVIGFAGVYVIGVALHLAPRFGSRPLAAPQLVRPLLLLLIAGLLARALGQPLADHAAFAALTVAGATLELLAALVFALLLARTLEPALRGGAPHAWLLAGGAGWLVVQAALGAWWVLELATEGVTTLPFEENGILVNLQFFGFLLSTILGVGTRSFPTFFGMPPTPPRGALSVAILLHAGVAAWTLGAIADLEAVTSAGQASAGLAILVAVATFGAWRRTIRLAAASRGYIRALQPALAWLALTGAGLLASAARALIEGEPVRFADIDALRHTFALGVVTLLIVAMSQLILPEFASERLVAQPWRHRGLAFGLALTVAAVHRGVLPWILEGDARYQEMAVGGVIGLASVAAFAFLYVRALRRHRAYLARIAPLRARGIPVRTLE